jgi:hypothetical protein
MDRPTAEKPHAPPPEPPHPVLTTREPWRVLGLSRSGWFRLRCAGLAPRPLDLPGVRPTYRVSDLMRWLDALGTTGRRHPAGPGRPRKGATPGRA